MIPVFENMEKMQEYISKHGHSSLFFEGIEITEKFMVEAKVDKPGWYLCRRDLRRCGVPWKHCIVRNG